MSNDLNDAELNAAATVHDRLSAVNVNAYVDPVALIEASRLQRAALEIKRHRSALAADRERIYGVVYAEAMRKMSLRIDLSDTHQIDAAHIATRVADQLATARPVLSTVDRDILLRMRKSIWYVGEFSNLLDRLLAGQASIFRPEDAAMLRGMWLDCAIGAATAVAHGADAEVTATAYKSRMELLDRLHVLATGRHCEADRNG